MFQKPLITFFFDHPAGTIGEYGGGLHFVALSPRALLLFARLPIAPRGHPRLSALSKIAGLLWPSPTRQGFAAPTSTSPSCPLREPLPSAATRGARGAAAGEGGGNRLCKKR